jgi:parallel beta helix pectate lyase-like protein
MLDHFQLRSLIVKRCLAVPFAIAAVMAAIFLSLTPASAQSRRTWVSRDGNNSNDCSQTAPCQTFQVALVKTSLHGEVDCLDAGDFGVVNIFQSVTIDCHSFGGITTNGADAMAVGISFIEPNDPNPQAILRNLSIQSNNTGIDGIVIMGDGAGSYISIEKVNITNNNISFDAVTGIGISDQRTHGLLLVSNSTIQNNALIGISLGSSNGSRRAVIKNTQVSNSGTGIHVGGNSEVVISHSDISDNATAGLVVSASTGSVTVDSTTIEHNGFAFQNSGTVRLSNSDVAYNATGWTGIINTFTNNRFTNNGAVGPLVPIGSLSNPTGEQ